MVGQPALLAQHCREAGLVEKAVVLATHSNDSDWRQAVQNIEQKIPQLG
jgi:hypothetical protein